MTDWLARARHEFSGMRPDPTAETDEMVVSSVSAVRLQDPSEKRGLVSSVLSVPLRGVSEKRMFAEEPAGPTTKAALVAAINRCCLLRGDKDDQRQALADECLALPESTQHDLIEHFGEQARIWKRAATPTDETDETMTERLTLGDRDGDARRLCIECAHYRGSRCRQAAQSGVGPEVGALALVLQNCSAFGPMGDRPCSAS